MLFRSHLVVLEGFLTAVNGTSSWQALATEQVVVRDVLAPVVTLLAPAAASYVDTGFTLRVAASDVHSTVATVQGLVAATPVAMAPGATAGEYIAIINATVEGPLLLSARAIDSAGNAAEAIARQVIVDLLPPVITIDGVAEGALVNQPVTLQIQITDVSPLQSTVTLDGQAFVSGNTVGSDGPHLLRVTATDTLGRSSEALRSFSIDRTPPVIQINLPSNGAIIFADSTRVVGATEALASVALNVGAFNATLVADGSGIFSLDNVPLVPGQNRIAARATDRAGNVGAEVAISVERRGQPVVALQGNINLTASDWPNGTPLAASFTLSNIGTVDLSAMPVRIEARRRDTQQLLQSAAYTIDLVAGAQRTPTFDWATSSWGLSHVDITLTATLPGQSAATTLDQHALRMVDREPPAVQFELPLANAQMRSGDRVRVLATDRLNQISKVELRVDNGAWKRMTKIQGAADKYRLALPTLSAGPHQLTARAYDAAGNLGSTLPLPITVIRGCPLDVDDDDDDDDDDDGDGDDDHDDGYDQGASATTDISGRTAPNATVRVRRADSLWTTTADINGGFILRAVPLNPGLNEFTVQAQDTFGDFSEIVRLTIISNSGIAPLPVPIGAWYLWLLLALLMVISVRMRAADNAHSTRAALAQHGLVRKSVKVTRS